MKPRTIRSILAAQIFCIAMLGTATIMAQDGPPVPKEYVGSAGLEQLKKLAGTWEGSSTKNKAHKVTAVYEVTAGGTVVRELLFQGTPFEMMTVYRDDETGKLGMTHYCSLQNESRMNLESASPETLQFKYAGGAKHDPAKDPHMHDLTISFPAQDKLEHKWVGHAGGKVAEVNVITFSRVKT